jgi:cyclohexanecarboxylate-CoA ligase
MVFMLAAGARSVLLEAFVAEEAVEVCRRHRATLTGGSTAFYQAYLAEQRKCPDERMIPSLRLLMGGGAPKPPEIFYEVKREMGIPIFHGFGMTEVSTATFGVPSDTDEQLACSDGRPLPGCEVRIVQADGRVAGADEDGEIRIRGPMVCKGYTDEERTGHPFDDEGYLKTGDLGHLRPDGRLVVTGRLKDVIIRKGENISAREVEDLLYQHPKVGDVAVIGLTDPDRGERVCAVVEQAPGQEALTMDEMVAHLRAAGLMIQKIPEQLEVVDELPRNQALRKVLKFELRDRFGAMPWPRPVTGTPATGAPGTGTPGMRGE